MAFLLGVVCPAMSLLSGGKLPPPLAPADGPHTFTYDSVQRRLPLIVEAVIENNQYSPELVGSLRGLAAEIAAGQALKPLASPNADWDVALAPMLASGETWFSAPWWLTENYFYKRMLELTDPATDCADPFAQQKADSLEGSAGAFEAALGAGLSDATELAPLVAASLWGNLADLSLSVGAKLVAPPAASSGSAQQDAGASSMMLADDTAALCEKLATCAGKEVLIILDNCGLEIVSDLLLVDGLLRLVNPSKVTLHAKDRPVFVSDVTVPDVEPTLSWLSDHGGDALAARLRSALGDGRLVVSAPSFYTTALPFWQAPPALREEFAAAAVVITKGDANYRRLLGDLHWPHDTGFAGLMDYWPTSIAALRTCKSGVLVGVEPEVEAAAAAAHPDKWLVAGLYGVVQARIVA